jgi:hypothetical protein
VLKMMEEVENNSEMLNAFLAQVDSKYIEPIISDIEDVFIGSDANPHSVSKLCALLDYIPNPDSHRILPSRNDLKEVCWAASASKPLQPIKEVQEPLEKLLSSEPQPLRTRPDGECKAELPLPFCSIKTIETCGVCEKCAFGICAPVPCLDCPTQEVEVPPGCRVAQKAVEDANAVYRSVCSWENERRTQLEDWKKEITAEWQKKRDRIEEKFASDLRNWEEQLKRWTKYREPSEIRRIAKSFVIENILRSPDHKTLAKELLDWSWKFAKGTQDITDFVDMTNDFLNPIRNLNLTLKGTSRIAFQSKANIINTRPKIKTESVFGFNDGKPALKVKFSTYKNDNENPKEGYVGGIDLLGLGIRMYADTQLFLGNNRIASHKLKEIDWTSDKLRFREKISKDETVILDKTVPLPFKK